MDFDSGGLAQALGLTKEPAQARAVIAECVPQDGDMNVRHAAKDAQRLLAREARRLHGQQRDAYDRLGLSA